MKQKEKWNPDVDNEKDAVEGNTDDKNEMESMPDTSVEETEPTSKLEAELTIANDKYLRLYSEFENYKRRTSKERIEQSKMAGMEIFLSFLPVIDDLERALKSMDTENDLKSVKEGLNLIYSKIKNITLAQGLKEMNAKGKMFDPEIHDAIANVGAESESQKGKVIDEIEKGYFLNDKVIRHAKVIVAN
ncbi:MAG: nucleotide exchange factor GrpE [Cyclobacteriaceae bacterium]